MICNKSLSRNLLPNKSELCSLLLLPFMFLLELCPGSGVWSCTFPHQSSLRNREMIGGLGPTCINLKLICTQLYTYHHCPAHPPPTHTNCRLYSYLIYQLSITVYSHRTQFSHPSPPLQPPNWALQLSPTSAQQLLTLPQPRPGQHKQYKTADI